jgi:hypothetical protein
MVPINQLPIPSTIEPNELISKSFVAEEELYFSSENTSMLQSPMKQSPQKASAPLDLERADKENHTPA